MNGRKIARGRRMRSLDDRLIDFAAYGIGALVILVTLYPLIYVISASFSDPVQVMAGKVVLLPVGWSLAGYQRIFSYDLVWVGYRNSIVYAFGGTLVSLTLTLPAAYALSRKDLRGRNAIMAYFAFTMFFNGGMIPTYIGKEGAVWNDEETLSGAGVGAGYAADRFRGGRGDDRADPWL